MAALAIDTTTIRRWTDGRMKTIFFNTSDSVSGGDDHIVTKLNGVDHALALHTSANYSDQIVVPNKDSAGAALAGACRINASPGHGIVRCMAVGY